MSDKLNQLLNEWKKPTWDMYFMTLALVASTRSPDNSTKHGCVVVDPQSHWVMSMGYNGYPAGSQDDLMPKGRPDKYLVTPHAEDNAISSAARHGNKLEGSIFYVTGRPCTPCFTKIIQAGAVGIVYGSVGSHCVTEKDSQLQELLLKGRNNFVLRQIEDHKFLEILKFAEDYYRLKAQQG